MRLSGIVPVTRAWNPGTRGRDLRHEIETRSPLPPCFLAEIISQTVLLDHVLSLGVWDAELLLAERRRRPRPGGKWHLDEVFIRIRGVLHNLWRPVDQQGAVLNILVQERGMGPLPSVSSNAHCMG